MGSAIQGSLDNQNEPRLTSLAHGGGCGCKIAPDRLQQILGDVSPSFPSPSLLVDAAGSDDAAVYQLSPTDAVIATTDFFMPIVDDPFDFGRIAATNALSDVYAMGGLPIFCLALVGMPISQLSDETIGQILAGGKSVAESAGAPVAGGHSIDSVEPIYGLAVTGRVHPDKILRNNTAQIGDVLILGKPLGIGVYSAALKKGQLPTTDYDEMIGSTTLLNRPGADLADIDGVHAVTDVTGFGLLGHAAEMARGANARMMINLKNTPIFEGAKRLAFDGVKTGASARNWAAIHNAMDFASPIDDPIRTLLTDPQTSGGLMVACAPTAASAVLAAFYHHGHDHAAVIGSVEDGAASVTVTEE